jgi:hypothetical protein
MRGGELAMKCRLLLVLLLVPTLAGPVRAGIIFGKKGKKPTPAERVPELLTTLKSDGDENKRARAAEELRQYDPNAFPDILPVLIDVLVNDQKPAVRAEAAQSLGKLRPISQQAGQALEYALTRDPSMRVRLQARSSLMQYHWAGYRGSAAKKDGAPLIQTGEPPLAGSEPQGPPPIINTTAPAPAPSPPARPGPQPAPLPLPPAPAAPGDASGPDLSPPQ